MLVNATRLRPTKAVLNRVLQAITIVIVVLLTLAMSATPAAGGRQLGELPPAGPINAIGPTNSANAKFVAAGYTELLGRTPDAAGLDFHVSRLAAGGDRTRFAFTYSMLFSAEGSQHEVRRAYDDLLDRAPDAAGESYWTRHLQGRSVLDLRVLLMAGDEYHLKAGGTDSAWIDALYLDALGRPADAGGHQYWLDLAQRGTPRALIVAGLYLSSEALGHRVDTYYGEALGRTPSAGERAGAVYTMQRIGERGLRAQLWASDEVFERYLEAALS